MTDPIELDYVSLMDHLKARSRPRDRVTSLLRKGELIRVKKGLYVRKNTPYSREILANLIYGPSYLSLEYALAYYGLIPESVQTVTSVTTQKNKRFDTAVGRFEYRHLGLRYFPIGIDRIEVNDGRAFLIASPEKAVFDLLYLRTPSIGHAEIAEHLFEELRIDQDAFNRLEFDRLSGLIEGCPRASILALKALPGGSNHGGSDG